jgi:hypothetical protein
MGDCFLEAVFEKYQKWPTNLGYFSPKYRLCIKFYKKWVGQKFGHFFDKLIWSPWFMLKLPAQALELFKKVLLNRFVRTLYVKSRKIDLKIIPCFIIWEL